MRKFEKKLKPG